MAEMTTQPIDIPRLPVFGWNTIGSNKHYYGASVPDIRNKVYTSSGRAAIYLGLRHLGINAGDTVLVPTYHCPTMVAPIVKLGATPSFYPITSTGAPNIEFILKTRNERVKAILVPHYFGLPQPLNTVRDFCDEHHIALIEDCAHAMFGDTDTNAVGATGDIAIASITKFFPVLEGGLLVSSKTPLNLPKLDNASLLDEIRVGVDMIELGARFGRLRGLAGLLNSAFKLKQRLRGRHTNASSMTTNTSSDTYPESFEFDTTLAQRRPALVARLMPTLGGHARIAAKRRLNYLRLSQELANHEGFSPLFPDLPTGAVPYVFPLLVADPEWKYRELRRLGLPVFRWDWRWPGTPTLEDDAGGGWSTSVFQLACHQDLSESDLVCIIDTITSICGRSPRA